MKRGRKAIYHEADYEYLTSFRSQSNHRMADCQFCHKANIKASKWHLHKHQENYEPEGTQINLNVIHELQMDVTETITDYGMSFLQSCFPSGISQGLAIKYRQSVIDSLTKALYINPMARKDEPVDESHSKGNKGLKKGKINPQVKQMSNDPTMPTDLWPSKVDNLDILFDQFNYCAGKSALDRKEVIFTYKHGLISIDQAKKQIAKKGKGSQNIEYLLKTCIVCSELLDQQDTSCKQCIFCHSKVHSYCLHLAKKCICTGKIIQRMFSPMNFGKHYKMPPIVKNVDVLSEGEILIKWFHPVTAKQVIEQYQQQLKSVLFTRSRLFYTCNAQYSDVCEAGPDALLNSLLNVAKKPLIDLYEMYQKGKYKAPVKLKIIEEDNYGIQTLEQIPANCLIGEYACDILPCIYAHCLDSKNNDKVMHYSTGETGREELMLAPFNCSNWVPLINCSSNDKHQTANCKSIRIIIDGRIRVLLYSVKTIKKGQELLYNYNGLMNEYQQF